MSIEFKPVDVTEADKQKQEIVPWVKEAIAATKKDLKKLTYQVNPFIKNVEGKEYWEYDIDKVREYLDRLKDITNFQDIAKISWEKTRGAYTVKWIMAVQIALKSLWFAPDLTIDWVLATHKNFSSSETVKVISQFQADNGLDVTGVPYGPTIKKLLEKLGGAVSGATPESNVNNKNATGKTPSGTALNTGGDKKKKEDVDSQTFEQSAIGKILEKLGGPATWLSSEVVQAWKKQAEDYFKDKNPKEYKSFSSLELANWKWIYYDPDQKDIQIGIFQNKLLKEGIVLQNDKILAIAWRRETAATPLFDKQPLQREQAPQNGAEWKQVEVSGKTDEELTREVINFFSQKDPKNPGTTIFATLAKWNGKDFEELGRVLSKLSLDSLTGKTEALRELKRNLNTIVILLNQNKRFMLFNGAQRKKDVLEQIVGIINQVWGIPEGELNEYKDLGALLQNKKTEIWSSATSQPTPDNIGKKPNNVGNNIDNVGNNIDNVGKKPNNVGNNIDNKDKLLNKENISFGTIMSETGKDRFGSAIYWENEANLKRDEQGNYYFLIDNEKYYKPHEDGKGNLIAQIPDAKYYETTKDWELTVVSFGKLDDWFISQPDFELRSDGKRKKLNEVEWE